MREQGFNPFLPSYEYIPDGEPRVFGDRVYLYGSHDSFNGDTYCPNDYVCYSAPVTDLKNWRYEGVIYKRGQDPRNPDGSMRLFAPDVARGFDGRYYLYYCLHALPVVSVAVCASPAGAYEFLGYVSHKDGTPLGEAPNDAPMFDPGVLVENGKVYLYSGFCPPDDEKRKGAAVAVLSSDMLTVTDPPRTVVPSESAAAGTSFEGHAFFEASSIRKINDIYYFVYSSVLYHELCYAVSKSPTEGFAFGGTVVSNSDLFIGAYKKPDFPAYYGGNNHGGLALINGGLFIFYHRHTNGTNFSRQACLEPLKIAADGKITQAQMTSSGSNLAPLKAKGRFPAYIACNLFCDTPCAYTAPPGSRLDARFPIITQDGKDGDETDGYIANMRGGATAGFKYFDCQNVKKISVTVKGGAQNAAFVIFTDFSAEPIGKIPLGASDAPRAYEAEINLPNGVTALYFKYSGEGAVDFEGFEFL